MELTVGVVSYNTRNITCRCIESVLRATSPFHKRVVLADNGSQDGTLDVVARTFPEVHLLSFLENPGYGEALNRILAQHPADFLLAMNADVLLDPESVKLLWQQLEKYPTSALSGPSLTWSDGSRQRSCKKFPTPKSLFLEPFALDSFFPFYSWFPNLDYDDLLFSEPTEVDSLSGAVTLIRSKPFREINGFDSSFRLYFEETDLCRRLRNAGHGILFVPQAKAVHVHAASTRQTLDRQITYYLSCHYYARKHFSPASARLVYAALQLSTLLRMAALTIKYFPSTKGECGILAAKLRACLHLLRELHSTVLSQREPEDLRSTSQ